MKTNVFTRIMVLAVLVLGSAVVVSAQAATYVITGSGTSFTAAKDGKTVGTANQRIRTVIDAIKTDAAGAACTIQFGNGTNVLNVGSDESISFENNYDESSRCVGACWGMVTLTGKLTSAKKIDKGSALIYVGNVKIDSKAQLSSTSSTSSATVFVITPKAPDFGDMVEDKGEFGLMVSGGSISSASGHAIVNYYTRLIISGGTVSGGSKTSGGGESAAIDVGNYGDGEVIVSGGLITSRVGGGIYGGNISISGGTVSGTGRTDAVYAVGRLEVSGGLVSSDSGHAIGCSSCGVYVSGDAIVTSGGWGATIFANRTMGLTISGGTVENIGIGWAIDVYSDERSSVTIRGGTISTRIDGVSVGGDCSKKYTLEGGLLFTYGTKVDDRCNIKNCKTKFVKWNAAAGNTAYTAFSSDDIVKLPEAATAVWANKGGKAGISVTDGEDRYFVAVDGVAVSKLASASVVFPTADAITYDPSVTLSQIALVGGSGDGTFAYKDGTIVPTVGNSGYEVVFTPADKDIYETLSQKVALIVNMAVTPTAPTGLTAFYGQTLESVHLPSGWSWVSAPTTSVGAVGTQTHKANFAGDANCYPSDNIDVSVDVKSPTAILTPDRTIPTPDHVNSASLVPSTAAVSGRGLTVGANPTSKRSGGVSFFCSGVRIESASLYVYDAAGNVVNEVAVDDRVIGNQARRVVGGWNFRNFKGHRVSEGMYLVRGTIKAVGGKKEKVSVVVSVR